MSIARLTLIVAGLLVLSLTLGCAATPTAVPPTQVPAAPTIAAGALAPMGVGAPPTSKALVSVAPTAKDLAYASVSNAQKLDLYVPQGAGPFPLIVAVHGGGFMMGDKADGTGLANGDALLNQGFAIASINYRLSAEAKFPAQIQDVKTAVRFLRANAAKYNLNPNKFGAWGASAGGNLVALLGTSCGIATLEGAEMGNADQSSCVQAVVDWFGPIDFLQMDAQFAGTTCPANHNEANSPESQLLGAAIQTKPDAAKAANPSTYLSAKTPPFLIQNGTADCNIPPIQNKNFADAVSAAIGKDKVIYVSLPGAGHGGSQFSEAANMKIVTDFLTTHLK